MLKPLSPVFATSTERSAVCYNSLNSDLLNGNPSLANIISDVHDLLLAELATAGEDEEANSTTNSCTLDCVIADEWADRLIAIDGSQIRHVLLNLIQNAIQAVLTAKMPR